MNSRPITHYDASTAADVAVTTEWNTLFNAATSQHASSVVRFAAALNRGISRDLLEQLVDDPAPHVAELVAARLQGMDKLERLIIGWALARDEGRNPENPMDPESIEVVRHITKKNVENPSVTNCMAMVRQALAKKNS